MFCEDVYNNEVIKSVQGGGGGLMTGKKINSLIIFEDFFGGLIFGPYY